MNLTQPPVLPRWGERPPEDIDGLLRAFYRAEMPDPWPVLTPPRTLLPIRSNALRRSRWALAASVAVLLLGTWFLASRFPATAPMPPDPYSDHGTASRRPATAPGMTPPAPEIYPEDPERGWR